MLWIHGKPWYKSRSFFTAYCKYIINRDTKLGLFFRRLWTHEKAWRKFLIFFTMFWTHQIPRCKFRCFFLNVVNTSKRLMQVSIFFTLLWTNQKTLMEVWIFFQNVENIWKILMQDSVFSSQCSWQIKTVMQVWIYFCQCFEHIKNCGVSFGLLFLILWTHQSRWGKFGSFFHNVVNTSKTVNQISVFILQSCEHINNRHTSFALFIAMLWTNQETWCIFWYFFTTLGPYRKTWLKFPSLFHNLVSTSKTVILV